MPNKIKIFVDAHVFDGLPQGSVTYIAGLYSELINDSRFQIFIGSNETDIARMYLRSSSFIHVKYNTNSRFIRLFYTIPKILKKYDIDFAHFQYVVPFKKTCIYIITIHDLLFLEFPEKFPFFYRFKNSILFFLSAKRADLVLTVSDYSKNSINHFFKMPLNKIYITPNAIFKKDQEKPEPIPQLQNKEFILFVSRIEPRKNQVSLLKVWKELNLFDQGFDLVLVGSKSLKDDHLLAEIKKLSETEKPHFHWLSDIPIKNLIWLYQKCSLFVFPSLAEGFGIPPLEAAIYGAKVICSNSTAMKDYHFFGNFQFNPESVNEFKKALISGIKNDFNHEYVISAIMSKYNCKKIAIEFGDLIYSFYKKKY